MSSVSVRKLSTFSRLFRMSSKDLSRFDDEGDLEVVLNGPEDSVGEASSDDSDVIVWLGALLCSNGNCLSVQVWPECLTHCKNNRDKRKFHKIKSQNWQTQGIIIKTPVAPCCGVYTIKNKIAEMIEENLWLKDNSYFSCWILSIFHNPRPLCHDADLVGNDIELTRIFLHSSFTHFLSILSQVISSFNNGCFFNNFSPPIFELNRNSTASNSSSSNSQHVRMNFYDENLWKLSCFDSL